MAEFKKTEGIDLFKEKQALQRIIEASEKAKIELSMLQSTRISLPFIYIDGQIPKNIDLEIDRSKFESLSKDLLERCKTPVEKALKDAKLSKSNIDEVILVGGSTRIPAVRNLLVDLLGKTLNETVNPDEVVAMGAAVQAGIIAGEITDLILLDVGAEYANYSSDLTRVIPVSGRFTERQKAVYNAVLNVKNEATKMLLPGTLWKQYHVEVGKIMTSELLGLGLLDKVDVQNENPDWK
jgi:molecular chaperone DnaK (HSP70)